MVFYKKFQNILDSTRRKAVKRLRAQQECWTLWVLGYEELCTKLPWQSCYLSCKGWHPCRGVAVVVHISSKPNWVKKTESTSFNPVACELH